MIRALMIACCVFAEPNSAATAGNAGEGDQGEKLPSMVIEREAEVKTGGDTLVFDIGQVPTGQDIRVDAKILNSTGVSLAMKVVPHCSCTASVPEFAMPAGEVASVAFDVRTEAEQRPMDVSATLSDESKGVTVPVVVRYVARHPATLGKRRVTVPTGVDSQVEIPIQTNFDGAVVKGVTVDSRFASVARVEDGRVTLKTEKTLGIVSEQLKIAVTCEHMGHERTYDLPLEVS